MTQATNFAEEFKLYESLFVESDNRTILIEKNKAELNNLKMDFETEIEKISRGKSLSDIASELTSLLRSTIEEYRVYETKKANHTTSETSMKSMFETKAKQILNFYANLVKTLKKPNNFTQAFSAISNTARQILGDYVDKSSAYKRLEQYEQILLKINELTADKKIKALALQEYHKTLIFELSGEYKSMKSSNYETLFD